MSEQDAPATKSDLRAQARRLRAEHASDTPVSFLSAFRGRPEWKAARTVALYLPFGVEPDTADLVADCHARGVRVAVPAWVPEAAFDSCVFPAPGAYALALLGPDDDLAAGPMGIPEPARKRWIRPDLVDLWILPGLLFDRAGHRLGHGKGHIDRLLAGRSDKAVVWGIAFPWQISARPIPAEPHDVAMDDIVLPRKDILLHACCGPCSTHCVRELRAAGYEPVVCYSNSNMDSAEEFDRRLEALRSFAAQEDLRVIVDPYDPDSWNRAVRGLEAEPEGGRRCDACFRHNLGRAARIAKEHGLSEITSSLTVSPHKNSPRVFAAGREAASAQGIRFAEFDFKKKDGFLDSVRLAKAYGLYRQSYCGCRYSKREKNG